MKLVSSSLNISYPNVDNDSTFAKPINDGTRNYICAKGQSEAWHVFAKVYDGDPPQDLSVPSKDDLSIAWTCTDSSNQWTFPLLLVPGLLGATQKKTLVVWEEATKPNYNHQCRIFFATANTSTYCEIYDGMTETVKVAKPAAKDWSSLPDRWQFQIAGVANASASNCGCLNGSWLLKRDGKNLLWARKLDASFADPKKPCWWRLSFNQDDGFWYLECVTDPKQPVGVSIAYRRHESAFDPCGANEMALLTCHGYCHVPDFVTLSPA